MLAADAVLAAANIAAPGAGIVGTKTNIDETLGTLVFHTGAGTNVIDNNLSSKVDTFTGGDAQPVGFAGVIWPGKHYETITSVTLTLATFGDGGWFGVPGAPAPAGGALAATNLIEPQVQVTTNRGVTWVIVPSTSDYQTVMLGHQVGGTGGQPNPSSRSSVFTLTTPATKVNGIRIIGTNGGRAGGDTNGFLGVFEVAVSADPFTDADGDGMADAWETEYEVGDPNDDPDFDGLSNVQEFVAFSNPILFDTDGDGLPDGDELSTYLTSPVDADTDRDGLSDGAEVNIYTSNPILADTDGDGLSDGAEVNIYNSNPVLVDSDGDIFSDRMEALYGGNPSNSAVFPDNLAMVGLSIIGVKDSIASGPDIIYSQQNFNTTRTNINDVNLATRIDTYNGGTLTTVSFVGIVWPFLITNQIVNLDLQMACFLDGGWFGVNAVGPGAGGALTLAHLTEPIVQVSTDSGSNWVAVPFTSNYTNQLLGFRIGGGGQPNPTSVKVTFTLTTPATSINAIRIIGTEGGTASRGFLGVFELGVRKAVSDSDGDGMSDSWELAHGLMVGVNDAALDADSDGLTNLEEFNRDTDPQVADTDADGLTDGYEVNVSHTFPTRADTDGDGLSDGAEVNTYFTNPLVRDSDNDGYLDGVEVAQGSNPASAASVPTNLALLSSATGLLGTKAVIDGNPGTPIFNAGTSGNINDGNLTTRVDSYANNGEVNSFVGILWSNVVTTPIVRLELTLACFFDGGWFGVNGIGPGTGGALGPAFLREPIVQVTTNGGAGWVTVPHASDYLTALNGHPLPTVDFGPPNAKTAYFIFINPLMNINGVRILGPEGGTASGGFLGVFELAARNMVADTDGDGMNDQWEGFFGLTVGVDDGGGDADGDGLSNLNEFRNNSNPLVVDTDGDGLNDGDEVNVHHTNPNQTDTDGDGLSDFAEVNTHLTNPTLADSDGDGFADGLELARATNPIDPASHPSNYAVVGLGLLGTKAALDDTPGTPVFNGGIAANINDDNLATGVDSYSVSSDTYSFVGVLWPRAFSNVTSIELDLATFFDGGWFGVNNIGPGSGQNLTARTHLLEPDVQVTSNGGATWTTVPHTSDYLTALDGHPLPAVDFGPPTLATATFHLVDGQTNINGIRLVGKEGGPASGGFLGVFEFKVGLDNPTPVVLMNVLIVGGQPQFQFRSKAGYTHLVQYKNNFDEATWQTLTTIPGDGSLKTFTDATAAGDHRIYRVTTE